MMDLYFKSIIEQDSAPVVICDTEHTVIYMNPASVKKYGVSIVGQSIKNCHNEQSNKAIDRVVEWFKKSKDNNIVYTAYSTRENKDLYMVALRDGKGELIGYYEKHEYRDREKSEKYQMK